MKRVVLSRLNAGLVNVVFFVNVVNRREVICRGRDDVDYFFLFLGRNVVCVVF